MGQNFRQPKHYFSISENISIFSNILLLNCTMSPEQHFSFKRMTLTEYTELEDISDTEFSLYRGHNFSLSGLGRFSNYPSLWASNIIFLIRQKLFFWSWLSSGIDATERRSYDRIISEMQFQIYVGLGIVGEKRWSWMKLPLWFLPSSIQCNSIYISLFEFTFHNVKWTYYKKQNCWPKTRNSKPIITYPLKLVVAPSSKSWGHGF